MKVAGSFKGATQQIMGVVRPDAVDNTQCDAYNNNSLSSYHRGVAHEALENDLDSTHTIYTSVGNPLITNKAINNTLQKHSTHSGMKRLIEQEYLPLYCSFVVKEVNSRFRHHPYID